MKKLIPVLAVLCLFAACKKKNNTPNTPLTAASYFMPMKTGNYWAYQRVSPPDTFQQTSGYTVYDTIRITADSIMNGQHYYYFTGGVFEYISDGWYADSSGYVILYPGARLDLNTTPNDTLGNNTAGQLQIISHTPSADTTVSVIAGGFTCWQIIHDYYYLNNQPPQGVSNPRTARYLFAPNVGEVAATTFFTGQSVAINIQLTGYHIAQ